MKLDQNDVWIILVTVIATIFVVLLYKRKLPSTSSMQDTLTMLNSRGGNIFILSVMSLYFFHGAVHMYYVIISQIQAGTLREDNAIALTGLQFITTSAFGGAMGALLKTMTSENSKPIEPKEVVPTVTNTLTFSGDGL